MTRLVVMTSAVCAVLVMAACAGPAGNGVDPLGPTELDAAFTTIGDAGEDVLAALEADAAIRSLGVPFGFAAAPMPPSPPMVLVAPLADVDLPRGVFDYDPMSGDWVLAQASTDLVYRWSFVDADDEVRAAVMRVDWGTTTEVDDDWGDTLEVPTDDMSMLLTIDGETGAAFDVELGWYTAQACPDGVLVPTRGLIDGSIGIDATLAMNAVGFTLSNDAFDTSGEIVATASSKAIGIDWDIGLGIDLTRIDCFIDDVQLIDGSVSVAVFGTDAGTTTRLALSFGFSDIVMDEAFSVAISNGQLRLNNTSIVTFAGTLDDANEDGVLGDNLNLTFADGTTMTLEAYLETYVIEAAAMVRRAVSLLR